MQTKKTHPSLKSHQLPLYFTLFYLLKNPNKTNNPAEWTDNGDSSNYIVRRALEKTWQIICVASKERMTANDSSIPRVRPLITFKNIVCWGSPRFIVEPPSHHPPVKNVVKCARRLAWGSVWHRKESSWSIFYGNVWRGGMTKWRRE